MTDVTTREEAAAGAVFEYDNEHAPSLKWGDESEPSRQYYLTAQTKALVAADAHDAAHGIHRTPESEVTALIVDRDEAQWWADKLAAALAPADVLGEHSSMNAPWANAYEHAAGTHRIRIDDATVERASEVLLGGYEWCECRRSPFDKHDVNPPCSTRTWARQTARSVLAAAMEVD